MFCQVAIEVSSKKGALDVVDDCLIDQLLPLTSMEEEDSAIFSPMARVDPHYMDDILSHSDRGGDKEGSTPGAAARNRSSTTINVRAKTASPGAETTSSGGETGYRNSYVDQLRGGFGGISF